MIFAITGTICSGKSVVAEFLKEQCDFVSINLIEEFA